MSSMGREKIISLESLRVGDTLLIATQGGGYFAYCHSGWRALFLMSLRVGDTLLSCFSAFSKSCFPLYIWCIHIAAYI